MRILLVGLLVLAVTAHAAPPSAQRCARLCTWAARHCTPLGADRLPVRRCTRRQGIAARCEAAHGGCIPFSTTTATETTTSSTTTTTRPLGVGPTDCGFDDLYKANLSTIEDGCGVVGSTPYTPVLYLFGTPDGCYADMNDATGGNGL